MNGNVIARMRASMLGLILLVAKMRLNYEDVQLEAHHKHVLRRPPPPQSTHDTTTRARTLGIQFREVMGDRHTHGVAEVAADPT